MEHKVGEYILKFKIQTPSVGKTATIVFLFIVKKKKKKLVSGGSIFSFFVPI